MIGAAKRTSRAEQRRRANGHAKRCSVAERRGNSGARCGESAANQSSERRGKGSSSQTAERSAENGGAEKTAVSSAFDRNNHDDSEQDFLTTHMLHVEQGSLQLATRQIDSILRIAASRGEISYIATSQQRAVLTTVSHRESEIHPRIRAFDRTVFVSTLAVSAHHPLRSSFMPSFESASDAPSRAPPHRPCRSNPTAAHSLKQQLAKALHLHRSSALAHSAPPALLCSSPLLSSPCLRPPLPPLLLRAPAPSPPRRP